MTPPASSTSTEPSDDALDSAWLPDGPIHLNCQFDDPLIPDPDSPRRSAPAGPRVEVSNVSDYPWRRGRGEGTPTPSRQARARWWSRATTPGRLHGCLRSGPGWPLLAEPSSGSRTGANPIRTYRLLLGTELGARIERAVVFGHPTLSRPVGRLLSRPEVEVVSVRTQGRWPHRPFPVASEHDRVSADEPQDTEWLEEWQAADRALGARVDAFVAEQPGLTPYDVAAAVNAANPPGGLVFVGASNPIRDLDLMATAHPVGEHRMVLSNRGLAGIDGTISSAIGDRARAAAQRARDRLRRRRDLPARRDRPGHRSGRGAAGPDRRGRQRRRRLDLRHPGAGSTRARRLLRAALRHPPRRRPGAASAPPPVRRTGGSRTGPSSSTPCPVPTAASRSSRQ